MIAGKYSYKPGVGKNSWLTGTAAWNWYAITQFILGIKPTYDGLQIEPCVPKSWNGYDVTRNFRGATYNIKVRRTAGYKGMKVNGKEVDGNIIPLQPSGSQCNIEYFLK